MKIRTGFVSNSSSSSFICDVCGQDASGWDMGLSDAEMVECKKGHVFCEEHSILTQEQYDHMLDDSEENEDYNDDWRYEFPKEGCPICSLKVIDSDEALKALRYTLGLTDEGIIAAIKTYRLNQENKK